MSVETIKLFKITSNILFFPCFAICTAMGDGRDKLAGESFLITILDGQQNTLHPLRMEYDARSFREANVPMNPDVAIDECLNQALLAYNQIVWQKSKEQGKVCTNER